jgi:hypothetical protein
MNESGTGCFMRELPVLIDSRPRRALAARRAASVGGRGAAQDLPPRWCVQLNWSRPMNTLPDDDRRSTEPPAAEAEPAAPASTAPGADEVLEQVGTHPLGTTLGVIGGAVTGAVVGIAAGPVGSLAGAIGGAVAGGLLGSGIGTAPVTGPVEVVDRPPEDAAAADEQEEARRG